MKKKKHNSKNKISFLKKPESLSLEEWQIALRRQVPQGVFFRMKNTGDDPVFSDFEIRNPVTGSGYRVTVRGEESGINHCTCPDFEVNTLGTCKHVEWTLLKLRRNKSVRELLKNPPAPEHSSVTLRYGIQRRVHFSFGKSVTAALRKTVRGYFDPQGFLTPEGFRRFDVFARDVQALKEDVRFHPAATTLIAGARDAESRQSRIREFLSKNSGEKIWMDSLKTKLYPYQKEGALFAARAGRCVIADDMGLGKTVQAVAAAELMARTFGVERVLIVCPTSLKHQWLQEIGKFTGRTAQVIQGLWHVRQPQYESPCFFKIVNYDVIHRDLAAIEKWSPDLVILDEAQRIKNWKTRLAKSVKRLSSPYAIVLTGTPLENRLEELHSIVEFVDRHHLGPLFRFLNAHQIADDSGKVTGYRRLHDLGKTLESVLIRRTKKEVLSQLPRRMDKNYFVKLTPEQRQIHEENGEIVARIANKWRKHHFLSEEDKRRLMIALQNMRMVCDNTYLVDKRTVKGPKVDELETLLREVFENPKNKVVIFSQWVRMGELTETMLEVNGWKHVYLHGGVPANKRGDLIRSFREDPDCRVFLSTDAGGIGLNLQRASVVVNLDLPWNPAVLEQRVGRVHRLGQRRAVQVVNFVSEDSIEQGMLALHRFKKSMFSGALDGGQDEVFMEGGRLNSFMKTVESATSSLKPHTPEAVQSEASESEAEGKAARQEVADEEGEQDSTDRPAQSVTTAPAFQRFDALIQTGIAWLSQMREDMKKDEKTNGYGSDAGGSGRSRFGVHTDAATGKQILQIPLPDEKTLDLILKSVSDLVKGLAETSDGRSRL